jgi:hypothetical protein
MSTLQVENLIGPTSGSNANKVIIPSGQTLDASGGGVKLPNGQKNIKNIWSASVATGLDITVNFSGFRALDVLHQFTVTPESTDSIFIINWSCGYTKGSSQSGMGFKLIRDGSEALGLDGTSRASNDYHGHRQAIVGTGYGNISGTKMYAPNSTSQMSIGMGVIIYDESSNSSIRVGNTSSRPFLITMTEIAQ